MAPKSWNHHRAFLDRNRRALCVLSRLAESIKQQLSDILSGPICAKRARKPTATLSSDPRAPATRARDPRSRPAPPTNAQGNRVRTCQATHARPRLAPATNARDRRLRREPATCPRDLRPRPSPGWLPRWLPCWQPCWPPRGLPRLRPGWLPRCCLVCCLVGSLIRESRLLRSDLVGCTRQNTRPATPISPRSVLVFTVAP